MPGDDHDLEQRVESAVEGLYDDERLRSELSDEEAAPLLRWAEARIEEVALSARDRREADAETLFDVAVQRVRKAVREINDLVGARDRLSDDQLRRRLTELLSPGRVSAGALPRDAEELVGRWRESDRVDLVNRLTTMVSRSWRVAGGSPRRRSSRRSSVPLLLGVLLVVVALGVQQLLGSGALGPRSVPTVPQEPSGANWYQVYFTTPSYPDRAADHHGGLDERLTSFINEASSSVDVAIYQLDLENVTNALLDAKSRGATVRVVTDVDILDDPKENPSFKKLQSAGITVVAGNPNAIMHDKFVVVDGKAVWTGSWNFTENDTYRYNNNGLLIRSPGLARNYTATFEKMWRDHQFGSKRKAGGTNPRLTIEGAEVDNYFSPEDGVTAKIVARLKAAQKSIDFMAYSFTDDDIGDQLLARAKAGVKVRGVFENTGSETRYSEYGRMKDAKMDVLQDGNPYLMHHKVFVVDGEAVVVGSFNFSESAETSNDENLLIVEEPGMASQFEAEFERVYAQAQNPPRK